MPTRKTLRIIGLLRLVFSLLLTFSIVIGYLNYREPLGQLTDALAASISSAANVMTLTASTVVERQALIGSTRQTLNGVHDLIAATKAAAINQRAVAPQYAASLRSASQTVNRIGDIVDSAGDGFMLSVPTRIDWEEGRPVVVMTRPFEKVGRASKAQAGELRLMSGSLLNISDAIGRDGEAVRAALLATADQSLRSVEELQRTLGDLQSDKLPNAVKEMQITAERLQNMSELVKESAASLATAFLVIGLILSGWCFLTSLHQLIAISHYPPGTDGSDEKRKDGKI